ncbi:hypothetical protein EDB19DRAFT_174281 [Suillus lakei]|nr:hypothetical protein EDB19DRAFT_174281 [Suillus lakei]
MMVSLVEQLANPSLAVMEHTSESTLEDRDSSEQEGQGCQHRAECTQAPPARSCSRKGGEHQNDLAPLFRLPDEILAEIIKHGAQTETGGGSFEKTVSHVSMRWRTVAISNPSLWADISVCHEETPSFLQTRIHRSVNVPINIDISPWLIQPARAAPQSLLVQLNIILGCASRWRSLTIRSGPVPSMFPFILLYFTRYGTSMPSLECVRLYGSEMLVQHWSLAFFFDERCAPRLSTLKVKNMKMFVSGLDSCNSTITTLILTRDVPSESVTTNFNEFMDIFASFPSLASLVIYGLPVNIPSHPHQSSTDDHQYPALTTLGIHHIDGARFSSLIVILALMFPGITHLNLTGPRAAPSLLEAVRSAGQIWPRLQKLVLNSFVGHEWSPIHRFLETYSFGDREDTTQEGCAEKIGL